MTVSQRTCTHHEGASAIAVCAECESDICGECHGVDLRGLAICGECRREFAPPGIPWEMGSPGMTLGGFGHTTAAVLAAPRTFFSRMAPGPSWGGAAIFGIICIAVGTFLNTLWQKAFDPSYGEQLAAYQDTLGISPQLVEISLFASIPFGAVILYFLHTALLFLALRIFVTDREAVTWSMVSRITGYALASYLLLVFPPIGEFSLGHFMMVIWLFNLEVSAVRWFFGLGFWRSMSVVLVPFMIFLFAVG